MADEVDVGVRAKTEAYAAEIGKIPGITEKAVADAAKKFERGLYEAQARAAANAAETARKTAEKIAGDNIKLAARLAAEGKAKLAETEKAAAAAAAATSKAWGETGKKLAEMAGGPVATLGNAVFELVPKAGAASAALGAVVTAGIGIAAVTAIAVAAATAVYSLAEAATAAEERLDKAGRSTLITAEQHQALEDYRDSTDRLGVAVDLVTAKMGSEFAPTVGRVKDALAALLLTGAETIDRLADIRDATQPWSDFLDTVTRTGAAIGTFGLSEVARSRVDEDLSILEGGLDEQTRIKAEAWEREAATEEEIRRENAKRAHAAIEARKREEEQEARDAEARGKAELARQKAAGAAAAQERKRQFDLAQMAAKANAERVGDSIERSVDVTTTALTELVAAAQRQVESYVRSVESAQQIAATKMVDSIQASIDAIEVATSAAVDEAFARDAAIKDSFASVGQSALDVTQSIADADARRTAEELANTKRRHDAVVTAIQAQRQIAREAAQEGNAAREAAARDELVKLQTRKAALERQQQADRQAALKAARVARGVAVFEAGVNTAAAITKAFALFGPPPSPAGIAAAAAATAAGLAQTVAITSQPMPKFYAGGMTGPGNALGEVGRDKHAHEGVLNAAAVRDIGGPAVIDALNGLRGDLRSRSDSGGDVFLGADLVGRRLARDPRFGMAMRNGRPTGLLDPFGRS